MSGYDPEWYQKNKARVQEQNRQWRIANKTRVKAQKRASYQKHRDQRRAAMRRNALKRLYGITEQDYDRMLAQQHGVCALCDRPPKVGRRLQVDHDHSTGKVRALLCFKCNAHLGLIEFKPEWTARVLQYLRHHKDGL